MGDARLMVSRRTAVGAALSAAGGMGAAGGLTGCAKAEVGEGVSATEDLMREHGVLRRILVVYRETAARLLGDPSGLDAGALGEAAELFRTFGEEYHERGLEEAHIFPALRKAGGAGGALVDTLLAQHARGREITAFIRSRCASGKVSPGDAAALAQALTVFARMYESHTAFEDTVAFQAWRKALSRRDLDEAAERFEAIERAQFKGDGFDLAVGQVARIEQRLGLQDLARYTAPAPA